MIDIFQTQYFLSACRQVRYHQAVLAMTLVMVIGSGVKSMGQEKNTTRSNGCANARASAKITSKGVYGYIEVANKCSENMYIPSVYGSVEVLSERENSQGKLVKTWRKSNLKSGNLFLSGNSSVIVERSADDSDWLGVFTDLRNLELEVREPKSVERGAPNSRATKITLNQDIKVLEFDGMSYFVRFYRTDTKNGLWSYNGSLTVYNNNGDKVRFTDVVKYRLTFDGISWIQEAKFKTVRKDDTDNFSGPAKFNYAPVIYFQITELPALEGHGYGNQVEAAYKGSSPAGKPSAAENTSNTSTTTSEKRTTTSSSGSVASVAPSDAWKGSGDHSVFMNLQSYKMSLNGEWDWLGSSDKPQEEPRLSHIFDNPGSMGMVYSSGLPYTKQILTYSDSETLADTLKRYYELGFSLTEVAGSDFYEKWILVFSKNSGLGKQQIFWNPIFPAADIKKFWAQNYRISSFGNRKGMWFVALSLEAEPRLQTYKQSKEFPKEFVLAEWDKDMYISDVDYKADEGLWTVVMSKMSSMKDQTFRIFSEFPAAWIREKWQTGSRITNIVYANGSWLIVLSAFN